MATLGLPLEGYVEVSATHFDLIMPELRYKYYKKNTNKGTSWFEWFTGDYSKLDSAFKEWFPKYCQLFELTKDSLTETYFLCRNENDAKKVEMILLNGIDFSIDVFEKLQNDYSEDDTFNSVAVCGDIHRGTWSIDPVIHFDYKEENEIDRNGNYDHGYVYHVTNQLTDSKWPQYLEWDKIKSSDCFNSKYHPKMDIKVCFVSTTLYRDHLPDFTVYPLNGNQLIETDMEHRTYFKRIKIPFQDISSRRPRLYYLCRVTSDNRVVHVNYICGTERDNIKGILRNIAQVKVGDTADIILQSSQKKTIIALPS